jgi:hypothetical protein
MQWRGKQVSTAKNQHRTIETVGKGVFMWSMPRPYSEYQREKLVSRP